MIDFVKLEDLAHRCIHIVRDLEEREILRRNQTEFEEMLGQKPHPSLPVSATGPIEQHNRDNPRLAGLHQSDDLESLIHRSEAARKKSKRVRFLHEVEFAREEVIEIDQFRILVRTPIADEIFYPRIKWRINCPQTSRRLIANWSPSKIFHAEHLTRAAFERTGFLSWRDTVAAATRVPKLMGADSPAP